MLIGMICFGILSALMSYYKKNYYVRVFNDILGKEEDENTAAKVGRGFWYGFWFLIYFSLLVTGLISLVAFLIVAGIIAAIVFVLVWISEKILPNELAGNILVGLLQKIGLRGAAVAPEPIEVPAAPLGTFTTPQQQAPVAQADTPQPADDASGSEQKSEEPKDDSPKP